MADKFFVVELTGGSPGDQMYVQPVWAEYVLEDDEYLQFIQEDGTLGGLFLRSIVRSWREATGDESSEWSRRAPRPS